MRNIAVIGAGAVGSLVGGLLTEAGQSVVLIDLWPAHVEHLKTTKLHISTSAGEHQVKVHILHIHEVAGLHQQFDIIFSAVNGYDVDWAMTLMEPLLKPDGWVIPLHDGMLEDRIAGVVGRERVLGLVIDRLGVNLPEPGNVVRYLTDHPTTFIVGELAATRTQRLEESVQLLSRVAGTVATDDIWGFHWSKLPRDCTRSPMTTLSGFDVNEAAGNPLIRRASIGVIAEVVRVGLALGHKIRAETLMGIEASLWLKAAQGERYDEVEKQFMAAASKVTLPRGLASMAQHMAKRRRTEIEYLNGHVVEKGREVRIQTPLNAGVTDAIREMERGRLQPGLQNIERILFQA